MDDERLEALARRLGEEGASRVETNRVVDRVLGRLRTEPAAAVTPRLWTGRGWVRWAAAAVLILAAGVGVRRQLGDGPPGQGVEVASAVGLAELGASELAEVMDSLEVEAPVAEFVVGLDDLTEEQLEALLRRLEG